MIAGKRYLKERRIPRLSSFTRRFRTGILPSGTSHKSLLLKFCTAGTLGLCIVGSGYGQTSEPPNPSVCQRTEELRNVIVALTSASDCNAVTSNQLATINVITLTETNITELRPGDFSGLTDSSLVLILQGNQLKTLPADIFAGISPSFIDLRNNPFGEGLPSALIADLTTRTNTVIVIVDLVFVQDTLPASLALTVGNTMELDLEDAFFYASGTNVRNPADSYEITVADDSAATAAVSGHTLTISAVSAGQTDIDIAGVRSSNGQRAIQTLTVQVITYPDPDPPVCVRTAEVQTEIVGRALSISGNCNEVTGSHLAAIIQISLPGQGIAELRSGDFAGLTHSGLLLNLAQNGLQTLPTDIFAGISPAFIDLRDNPFGKGLPSALIADLKTRRAAINLDLVFVQDTLPASLVLTVGNTMNVDLEDAFFYAVDTDTRSPADNYEITVAAASAATAAVNGHTLTISAVGAGQTDIDIVGVQTSNEQRATQTLTVATEAQPQTYLKFRIKVFLEGAQ